MRRLGLAAAVGFAVIASNAPARASTLTPTETKWALRARAVWGAYRLDWDSKAKLRRAERDLLAAGSKREATANLRAVLGKLPLSDPARYPIGFTMAVLGLGYKDGREVLIRYLREDKPYGVTVSEHSVLPDPNDDPRKADIASEWDGLAGMVYFVYQRHQDPVLVSELLDYRSQRGPRDAFLPVEKVYPKLSRIARSQHDSLRKTARRLLDDVREEQREQGMKAEPAAHPAAK